MTGGLFIVSAPSGAGKTSLVKALAGSMERVALSVSHTTRAMRPGERDGVHYHFVTRTTFDAMAAAGGFLESARVYDHRYGTARESVTQPLKTGRDVILEIDWQGARQIRAQWPRSLSIFILPPSREALETRLRARRQDSEAVIQRRMRAAIAELRHYEEFDYLIVNDEFKAALSNLESIIRCQRATTPRQAALHATRLQALLGTG